MVQIDLTFNPLLEDVWGIYGFTRQYHGRRPSILIDTKFIRSATVIMFMPTPIVICAINVLELSNCLNRLAHIGVKSRILELMPLVVVRNYVTATKLGSWYGVDC